VVRDYSSLTTSSCLVITSGRHQMHNSGHIRVYVVCGIRLPGTPSAGQPASENNLAKAGIRSGEPGCSNDERLTLHMASMS
jgi:hypothetical protein